MLPKWCIQSLISYVFFLGDVHPRSVTVLPQQPKAYMTTMLATVTHLIILGEMWEEEKTWIDIYKCIYTRAGKNMKC